jgi:hypothetical protein
MQIVTDGSALRGYFDHVAVVLRLSKGDEVKDIALGMALTDSKTAEGEIETIDTRIFQTLRRYLDKWRAEHVRMFGPKDDGLKCIPDSSGLDWDRLSRSSTMSDACPQAVLMATKIAEKVREKYIERIGQPAWDILSPEEQAELVHVHNAFCLNHLRCTGLRRAVKLEASLLDPLLRASIDIMDAAFRVTGQLSACVRAVSKNFTYAGYKDLYVKGKGLVFFSFILQHSPGTIIAIIERYDLGTRFDIEFEACVPIMINYTPMMKYLKHSIDLNPKGNILETNLFICLGSLEFMAGTRARAIFHVLVNQPLRFITNSKELGFCVIDMSKPMQALHDFLELAAADGALLLSPSLDIFGDTLTEPEHQAAYADYKRVIRDQTLKSVDGKTKVKAWNLIVAALFEPALDCVQYRDMTADCLQALCRGYREAMGDTEVMHLLSGGKYDKSAASAEMLSELKGTAAVSDAVERLYGIGKQKAVVHQGIDLATLNGLTVEAFNHSFVEFDSPDSRSQGGGGRSDPTAIFDLLTASAANSLLSTSRKLANPEMEKEKKHRVQHVESKQIALQEAAEKELDREASASAKASKYFVMERWTSEAEMMAALQKMESERDQLEALKEQFRVREFGFGWVEYHQPWSMEGTAFGVADLQYALAEVMKDEQGRTAPSEPPTYRPRCQLLPGLGRLTPEAAQLRQESTYTAEQLRRRRLELEAALQLKHEAKERAKRDEHALCQPEDPPPLDETLVGKKLEILEELCEPDDATEVEEAAVGGGARPTPNLRYYKQWLPATVAMMSTKRQKKCGKGARQASVSRGQFFLNFDDGDRRWVFLKSENFNCMRAGSWRLDLDEPQNWPQGYTGAVASAAAAAASESEAEAKSEAESVAECTNVSDTSEDYSEPESESE